MTTPPAAVAGRATRGRVLRPRWTGLLFALPALLFVVTFFFVPLGMTIWISLHNWPLLGQKTFIGLGNYVQLASDAEFWKSLRFTALYTLVLTPVLFVLAFGLANLANLKTRIAGIFRTAVFLPSVIGLGTASLLFLWMFNDQVGVLNAGLQSLGLIKQPYLWQIGYFSSMLAVIGMIVWKTVGASMLFMLIGIQSIPAELHEAARVDGASPWQRTRFITLPLMKRTFALALILSVTGSFLAFDQFYIMTGGAPNNSTITVVYWIYNTAFGYYKLGYASALSLVLLLVLGALSAVQLRLLRDET